MPRTLLFLSLLIVIVPGFIKAAPPPPAGASNAQQITVAILSGDESVRIRKKGSLVQVGQAQLTKGEVFDVRGKSMSGCLIAISENEDAVLQRPPHVVSVPRSAPFEKKLEFAAGLFADHQARKFSGFWDDRDLLATGVAMSNMASQPAGTVSAAPATATKGKVGLFGVTAQVSGGFNLRISSEQMAAAQQGRLNKDLDGIQARIDAFLKRPVSRLEMAEIDRLTRDVVFTATTLGLEETLTRATGMQTGFDNSLKSLKLR